MTPTRPILHRDGSVTYWSVTAQTWHCRTRYVPDADYAAMPPVERQRILRHLERHDA